MLAGRPGLAPVPIWSLYKQSHLPSAEWRLTVVKLVRFQSVKAMFPGTVQWLWSIVSLTVTIHHIKLQKRCSWHLLGYCDIKGPFTLGMDLHCSVWTSLNPSSLPYKSFVMSYVTLINNHGPDIRSYATLCNEPYSNCLSI